MTKTKTKLKQLTKKTLVYTSCHAYLLTYFLTCYVIIIMSIEEKLVIQVQSNCTKSLENSNPSVLYFVCRLFSYSLTSLFAWPTNITQLDFSL